MKANRMKTNAVAEAAVLVGTMMCAGCMTGSRDIPVAERQTLHISEDGRDVYGWRIGAVCS